MVSRIEAIERQVILSAMPDSEDFPVPFPLVRLHAEVTGAEAGKLRDFGGGQKISAVQNGRLGFDEHTGLVACCFRRSDVRQQDVDHLFQGFFLLGAGRLLFGMSWGSEPGWLALVVVATSLAAMGLALLVAAVARTETQVAIYGTLLVLVLAGLSGAMMDRALMSEQMLTLSLFTPQAWALDAYRQLLASPEPNLTMVARACAVLAAFGFGFITLAWAMLKLE